MQYAIICINMDNYFQNGKGVGKIMMIKLSEYGFPAAGKPWKIKEKPSVLLCGKTNLQAPNGDLSMLQEGGWLK